MHSSVLHRSLQRPIKRPEVYDSLQRSCQRARRKGARSLFWRGQGGRLLRLPVQVSGVAAASGQPSGQHRWDHELFQRFTKFAGGLSWRLGGTVLQYLERVDVQLLLQAAQLLASLIFVVLYVWSTYQPPDPCCFRYKLDVFLSAVFAVEYVFRLVTSPNVPQALLHPLNLVDFLAFAPTLLEASPMYQSLCHLVGLESLETRWFRVFRALRLLRLSLLTGNLPNMKLSKGALLYGAVNVRLMQLLASVMALLFTTASLVHVLEQIPWHDALYFVTTTFTTVGYGDLVVHTLIGKIVVLVMMAVGVVVIPSRASQLWQQLAARRATLGQLPAGRRPFVLLSTKLAEVRGFSDFFQAFFREVDGTTLARQLHMLCLCNKPSYEFKAFQDLNDRRLSLVEGSVLSERDLQRVRAECAQAALVLADRFTSNSAAEDQDVQFRVWALKAYTNAVPLYVQVLQRSSIERILPFLDPTRDVIVSVEQTRHRLLALSCLNPGASTLLGNLLHSASVSPALEAETSLAGRVWLKEYVQGCAYELFQVDLCEHLAGNKNFIAVVREVYEADPSVVVLGVMNSSGRMLLNPVEHWLQPCDKLVVMAKAQAAAQRVLQRVAVAAAAAPAPGSGSSVHHVFFATPSDGIDSDSEEWAQRKAAAQLRNQAQQGTAHTAGSLAPARSEGPARDQHVADFDATRPGCPAGPTHDQHIADFDPTGPRRSSVTAHDQQIAGFVRAKPERSAGTARDQHIADCHCDSDSDSMPMQTMYSNQGHTGVDDNCPSAVVSDNMSAADVLQGLPIKRSKYSQKQQLEMQQNEWALGEVNPTALREANNTALRGGNDFACFTLVRNCTELDSSRDQCSLDVLRVDAHLEHTQHRQHMQCSHNSQHVQHDHGQHDCGKHGYNQRGDGQQSRSSTSPTPGVQPSSPPPCLPQPSSSASSPISTALSSSSSTPAEPLGAAATSSPSSSMSAISALDHHPLMAGVKPSPPAPYSTWEDKSTDDDDLGMCELFAAFAAESESFDEVDALPNCTQEQIFRILNKFRQEPPGPQGVPYTLPYTASSGSDAHWSAAASQAAHYSPIWLGEAAMMSGEGFLVPATQQTEQPVQQKPPYVDWTDRWAVEPGHCSDCQPKSPGRWQAPAPGCPGRSPGESGSNYTSSAREQLLHGYFAGSPQHEGENVNWAKRGRTDWVGGPTADTLRRAKHDSREGGRMPQAGMGCERRAGAAFSGQPWSSQYGPHDTHSDIHPDMHSGTCPGRYSATHPDCWSVTATSVRETLAEGNITTSKRRHNRPGEANRANDNFLRRGIKWMQPQKSTNRGESSGMRSNNSSNSGAAAANYEQACQSLAEWHKSKFGQNGSELELGHLDSRLGHIGTDLVGVASELDHRGSKFGHTGIGNFAGLPNVGHIGTEFSHMDLDLGRAGDDFGTAGGQFGSAGGKVGTAVREFGPAAGKFSHQPGSILVHIHSDAESGIASRVQGNVGHNHHSGLTHHQKRHVAAVPAHKDVRLDTDQAYDCSISSQQNDIGSSQVDRNLHMFRRDDTSLGQTDARKSATDVQPLINTEAYTMIGTSIGHAQGHEREKDVTVPQGHAQRNTQNWHRGTNNVLEHISQEKTRPRTADRGRSKDWQGDHHMGHHVADDMDSGAGLPVDRHMDRHIDQQQDRHMDRHITGQKLDCQKHLRLDHHIDRHMDEQLDRHMDSPIGHHVAQHVDRHVHEHMDQCTSLYSGYRANTASSGPSFGELQPGSTHISHMANVHLSNNGQARNSQPLAYGPPNHVQAGYRETDDGQVIYSQTYGQAEHEHGQLPDYGQKHYGQPPDHASHATAQHHSVQAGVRRNEPRSHVDCMGPMEQHMYHVAGLRDSIAHGSSSSRWPQHAQQQGPADWPPAAPWSQHAQQHGTGYYVQPGLRGAVGMGEKGWHMGERGLHLGETGQPHRTAAATLSVREQKRIRQVNRQAPDDLEHGVDELPPDLTDHIIVSGAEESFAAFVSQLHTCEPRRLPVVVLHPRRPVNVLQHIAMMGPVYYVQGNPSAFEALQATRAVHARALVYLSTRQRPTPLGSQLEGFDYGTTTRSAISTDAEALLTSYGVGEELLPDMMHAVVELGFTSSVRFLQPGLLNLQCVVPLGHHQPPKPPSPSRPSSKSRRRRRLPRQDRRDSPSPFPSCSGSCSPSGSRSPLRSHFLDPPPSSTNRTSTPHPAHGPWDTILHAVQSLLHSIGSPNPSPPSPSLFPSPFPSPSPSPSPSSPHPASPSPSLPPSYSPPHSPFPSPSLSPSQSYSASCPHPARIPPSPHCRSLDLSPPSTRPHPLDRGPLFAHVPPNRQPRRSWVLRKVQERSAMAEGLAEWQANPYFCAGRVTVPALLDTFACQAFFKKGLLLDIMTELAGDGGGLLKSSQYPGTALQTIPLPPHLVGRTYRDLFSHLVTQDSLIPLGLYRKKSENPAWRLNYVATNPLPDTLLDAHDMVYVLKARA